ncbi:MAG: mechanosensitive ion channel [Lentisphaerae bacterium]|jgi:hypothetical protein|nr:mechanosensitive ion channel [Lentisphaerota bacterium]
MEALRGFIDPFLNTLGKYLPNAFGALIVLILGWLLIELLAKGLRALLGKIKLDEKLCCGKEDCQHAAGKGFSSVLVTFFRYLLLLCLLLLVLDVLGVKGVLDPVLKMFDQFMLAVPNIIAALLIGVIGYIIASAASAVVATLVSALDHWKAKLGMAESFSLARFVGQIVFIFVFVPVLIAALDVLKIEALSKPAIDMLQSLMLAVPKILSAAIILAVAYFVGRFVTAVVSDLLKNLGIDAVPGKLGLESSFSKFTLSKVIGGVAMFFIMLAALVSAVEKLQMAKLSELLGQLTLFAGDIALGLVILVIGSLLAKAAHSAMCAAGSSLFMANLARVAIIGLVAAMGLRSMGIADDIVRMAFGLTLGGVAVAFALSFGLGGREAAGKQLEDWFEKLRKK